MIKSFLFAFTICAIPIVSAHEGKSDIRLYGPLHVNWSHWKKIENGYVTSINDGGKDERFLALNCKKQKINVTNSKKEWKRWWGPSPHHPFEQRLIEDLCNEQEQELSTQSSSSNAINHNQ